MVFAGTVFIGSMPREVAAPTVRNMAGISNPTSQTPFRDIMVNILTLMCQRQFGKDISNQYLTII